MTRPNPNNPMISPVDFAIMRSEIEQLMAEFAWLIDHDEAERVADLFTEDGVYAIEGGPPSSGRAEIRSAYAKRTARGERTARHVFTNIRVIPECPDVARVHSILLLFAEDGPPPGQALPLLVADYRDRLTRLPDGCWRFAERIAARPAFLQSGSGPPVLPLGQDTKR